MENITSDDPEVESLVEKHLERCQFTLTQQEALCDSHDSTCQNVTLPPECKFVRFFVCFVIKIK